MQRGRGVFARRLKPHIRAEKAPTGFGVLTCGFNAQKPVAPMTYTDLLAFRATI